MAALESAEDQANAQRPARRQSKSSSFRGVSRCAKDGRWQARIRVGKKVEYLGRFKEEEEAARRYDVAAREFHGNRAVLNFADDEEAAAESLLPAPQSSSPSMISGFSGIAAPGLLTPGSEGLMAPNDLQATITFANNVVAAFDSLTSRLSSAAAAVATAPFGAPTASAAPVLNLAPSSRRSPRTATTTPASP